MSHGRNNVHCDQIFIEVSKLRQLRQHVSIGSIFLYYIEFSDLIELTYIYIIRELRNKIGFAALATLEEYKHAH